MKATNVSGTQAQKDVLLGVLFVVCGVFRWTRHEGVACTGCSSPWHKSPGASIGDVHLVEADAMAVGAHSRHCGEGPEHCPFCWSDLRELEDDEGWRSPVADGRPERSEAERGTESEGRCAEDAAPVGHRHIHPSAGCATCAQNLCGHRWQTPTGKWVTCELPLGHWRRPGINTDLHCGTMLGGAMVHQRATCGVEYSCAIGTPGVRVSHGTTVATCTLLPGHDGWHGIRCGAVDDATLVRCHERVGHARGHRADYPDAADGEVAGFGWTDASHVVPGATAATSDAMHGFDATGWRLP